MTMGLFADDDLQDQRLTLLERHIRALTEAVQQNQADIAACLISQLIVQKQLEAKVSASDIDPAIGALNAQVAEARVRLKQVAGEAAGTWAGAQSDLRSMMDGLRAKVQEATEEAQDS
jgi:hypothetical protein